MRELKFHEKKLLRKVNLYEWGNGRNVREAEIMRRYHITKREDLMNYMKVIGRIRHMVHKLKELPQDDEVRIKLTQALLKKLYDMGLTPALATNLKAAEDVPASAFARRRLPVVMVKLKMAQRVADASKFVEQGHVRVGPVTTSNPSAHVPRDMEDYVTWVKSSAINRRIQKYNDQVDDFE
ncbi:ribosomal protein S4/S9 [Kipferlia bialata]|nr:ribosomal protein S4/S9 [Kipferlia bialata]|eukprot:g5112.t1